MFLISKKYQLAVFHHNTGAISNTSTSHNVSSTQFSLSSFQFKVRNFIFLKGERKKDEKSIFFKKGRQANHWISDSLKKKNLNSRLVPQPDGNERRRQCSIYTGLSNMQQFLVQGFSDHAAHKHWHRKTFSNVCHHKVSPKRLLEITDYAGKDLPVRAATESLAPPVLIPSQSHTLDSNQ